MKGMIVEHFGGTATVANRDELERVLFQKYADDVNEFWIAGPERFPALTVLVRGAQANVHYFPRENHPGFISENGTSSRWKVTFYTGSPTQEIQVGAEFVVTLHEATKAALEFFESGSLPPSLRWTEL
jgi:hypothetical protein